MLPARVRAGAQWSDACILNISSRGLMIQSGRAGPEGSVLELRRGNYVFTARVVWRDGARAGLQSDERLPVEEILSLCKSNTLQLVACEGALIDRRKQPRSGADSRVIGRSIEFAGIAAIAAALALGAWAMADRAFARPLTRIEKAFGDQS